MSCVYAHTKVSPIALSALLRCRMASVHSVFASSLNLMVGCQLVHVGSTESELSCFGLTVETAELERVIEHVSAGDLVRIGQGSLLFYCTSGPVYVSLGEQMLHDMHVQKVRSDAFGALVHLIEREHLEDKVGLRVDPALWFALWPNNYALKARAKKLEAMRFLLGRGLGLTPSGDDMLLGFGVGLMLQGFGQSYLNSLAELLPANTTDVSMAYLFALLEGEVNETYIELAGALERCNLSDMQKSIRHIQELGHTSGADGLYGLMESFKVNPYRNY